MAKKNKPGTGESNLPPPPKKQKRLFKYRRAGVLLSEDEVQMIKHGRKRIRKEMRESGIRSRKEFEQMASGMGLYFDKRRGWAFLLWLLRGKFLWLLLGSLLTLLAVLFLFSLVTKMKGHFTVNLTDDLFEEGFIIAEAKDEKGELINATAYLYGDPLLNTPCISITSLPEGLDLVDGSHNGEDYFAYTVYIQNRGIRTGGYEYQVLVNSESLDVSRAIWVMVFEDGEMTFYAQAGADGNPEAIPARSDRTRGYRRIPYMDQIRSPETQYEVIPSDTPATYYRLIPVPFESEQVVTTAAKTDVEPGEIHQYTVVVWLEGDDPDCTNELKGGHFGLELNFRLLEEENEEE